MRETTTFIKLDRNITKWRWYTDANTMRVFIHLLLEANISDNDFMGVTIHRGQLVTSYDSIAGTLKLTRKQVRTVFEHLKMTGEVASKVYPKFQVITILSYDRYQAKGQSTGQSTGQSKGSQRAVKGHQYKNIKKYKKENNIGGDALSPFEGEAPAPADIPFFAKDFPHIGTGDRWMILDGTVYIYPASWVEEAERAGKHLDYYVRSRYE